MLSVGVRHAFGLRNESSGCLLLGSPCRLRADSVQPRTESVIVMYSAEPKVSTYR